MNQQTTEEISQSQVSDLVRTVLQRVLGGKEVDDSFSLNDESVDSLTRVEIVMELESSIASDFGIKETIPEQFTEEISTVGDLATKLYHFINQKNLSLLQGEGN